jgi:predicted amidohydrolase
MKTWPTHVLEPPETLTVAAIQAEPVPGDVAGNAKSGARMVAAAADRGARIAVLPELFLPAYHPPTLAANPDTDVAADDQRNVHDPRLEPLRDTARDRGVVIVIGAAVRHPDGHRTCSSLIVDLAGRAQVGYDKQQLWGPEENSLFSAGADGATLTVDGWRFGLGICYDGCFPEHGRAAALAGADGYLIPSGYLVGSEHRRDVYYAARALDNTMYVVFANSVGGQAPYEFNGGAAIYEPEGRAVQKAANVGECVVVAELSRNALLETRTDHSMLVDRRSDLGGRRFLGA